MYPAPDMPLTLSPPQPLLPEHRTSDFECGEPALNEWLKRRAMANQVHGASRCFVVVDKQQQVYGYYALAAGAVAHSLATGGVRRNMPDPVPVMVLARLAVDQRAQGRKLGAALLQDALNRTQMVAQHTGVRALLVHAISDSAKQFYEYYGFQASPLQAMTLMLRLPGAFGTPQPPNSNEPSG